MQFRDLKQQYQVLKKDMDAAMVEVATNCNFINGQQVKDLEKELAEYVGVKHCVTCANGYGCADYGYDGLGDQRRRCGVCSGFHVLLFRRNRISCRC